MLIDITRKLEKDIYVYPGDPVFSAEKICRTENGDICTVTALSLGTHTGTHIDSPAHFLRGGRTIDTYSLDDLCGRAIVIGCDGYEITPEMIGDIDRIDEGMIVLFKTPWSAFDGKTPLERDSFLTGEAASLLVSKKVKLVGIDSLSPDREDGEEFPVHITLLKAGIPILENIDLSKVSPGIYNLYCFPIKITGAEAAPARAAIELI